MKVQQEVICLCSQCGGRLTVTNILAFVTKQTPTLEIQVDPCDVCLREVVECFTEE